MKKPRLALAIAALAIATAGITGCSAATSNGDANGTPPKSVEPSDSATPENTDSGDTVDTDGSAASGDLVEPGAVIAKNEWMTYEFTNYDDKKAVLQARLTNVTPATQEQADWLVQQSSKLKGYHITLVTFEQRKVSGDDITYSADYTDFRPATAAGEAAQYVSVIGWDDCPSTSFSAEFNSGAETITSCVVGVSVDGGDDVDGLLYTGSSSLDDNPFSSYDGKPVFLKG